MTAALPEPSASLGLPSPSSGRHRAPEEATSGSMGVLPQQLLSRSAHGGSTARAAHGGPRGAAAPLQRAARTAGLSLAALGALAGAGGAAGHGLVGGDEPATTGEFSLPTDLASADMTVADPSPASVSPVSAVSDSVTTVIPVVSRATAAPAVKTDSPASREAAAEKAQKAEKLQQAAEDKAAKQKEAAQEKAKDAAASSLGSQALAEAKSMIGTPYEWGATGPSAFDCSGLMQWAYEQVGKDLPRTSSAQSHTGEKISTDELQPGDLVFMYSPVSHVGMYAGNGKIIEAPTEGEDVKLTDIDHYSDEIVSARRV